MEYGKRALKKVKWLNSLAITAVFCLLMFQSGSSVQPNRASSVSTEEWSTGSFPELNPELFQSGDVILRRGRSLVSALISRSFPQGQQMSQCGILISEYGSWKVIHSISGRIDKRDGIRIDTLADFLSQARPGMALHISPGFEVDRELLVDRAKHYLAQQSPFDHDYDLNDSEKLYCTELVRAVYLDAGAQDVFRLIHLAGKDLVDIAGFFDEQYWGLGTRD